MAYCRCGEDSDIYCYASNNGWNIHIAYGIGMPRAGDYYVRESEELTLKLLEQLQKEGYRGAEPAIKRLKNEIAINYGIYT